MTWAQRLKRVFKPDLESCAGCGAGAGDPLHRRPGGDREDSGDRQASRINKMIQVRFNTPHLRALMVAGSRWYFQMSVRVRVDSRTRV
jgi:hypothetical protein